MSTTYQSFSNNSTGTVSVANTNLDGTGAVVSVFQAGLTPASAGSVVSSIQIKSTVSNQLGAVRIYFSPSTGASNYLWREVMVPANNQSGTVSAFEETINAPVFLPAGYQIMASTNNSETFNITVNATDYINTTR